MSKSHEAHGSEGTAEFHEHPSWIERYWPVLLITFAVVCILCLDFCHPTY